MLDLALRSRLRRLKADREFAKSMAWFSGLAAKLKEPPSLRDFVREPDARPARKRLRPGESLVVMDQWRFAMAAPATPDRQRPGPRKKPKPK